MGHEFDPGPVQEPFLSLCRDFPGAEVYPPDLFRVEWGPIFHRGRLDGSARILIFGQDPGQHESIARRCMVGEAGQRVQGFMAKLGLTRSYVITNAFLYSVYGQPSAKDLKPWQDDIAAYREKWLDALLLDGNVETVIAFGGLAEEAFERWQQRPAAQDAQLLFKPLLHPTYPEGSSRGDAEAKAKAMKRMLDQWNEALTELDAALTERDSPPDLTPYGDELTEADRAPIPEQDMPVGSPPWMRSLKQWASRKGKDAADDEGKRATIEVVVPKDERPWQKI